MPKYCKYTAPRLKQLKKTPTWSEIQSKQCLTLYFDIFRNNIDTFLFNTVFNIEKRKEKKSTCSEFSWLSKFFSVFSLFVFGSQRFAADLLTLIIALLWRFWVGLHVSAIETGEERRGETWFSIHR